VTRRPGVLVLVTSNARRGAEVFGSQLVEGLGERGWQASIAALTATAAGAATIDANVLGTRSTGLDAGLVRAVAGEIERLEPDVVLANGGATLRYAVAAVRTRRRRPTLVYGSIGEPMYWVRNRRHRITLALQLAMCDAVIAVSRATRSQLVDQVGVSSDKVTVVSTGVSSRWLDLATDPGAEPFNLVWIGSLSIEKDPALALDAFAAAAIPGATLRFVGDGPLRSELEGRDVPGVEFVGVVPDVAPHLEWARALLLSSRTEGLPGVVLEALGSGLPVIATAVGGVGDVVVDAKTGRLVPARDVGALAVAITGLASDPAGRVRMGAEGRALIAGSYLFAHSFDRYDAVLRGMVKGTDQ
jgi:glycosyltransferase involved in cell wall biosynthesis